MCHASQTVSSPEQFNAQAGVWLTNASADADIGQRMLQCGCAQLKTLRPHRLYGFEDASKYTNVPIPDD